MKNRAIKLTMPFALFMLMGASNVMARGLSVESLQAISSMVSNANSVIETTKNIAPQVLAQNNQSVRNAATNTKQPGLCPEHYPLGIPVVISVERDKVERRSFYLCRAGYALQFDPATKTPLWVAERLTNEQLGAEREDRTDDFRPDPDIPAPAQASLNDYRGSKFDRGHMAPAADMGGKGASAMSESFYLTNMIPQVGPNQNRGIWADLEGSVRQWAKQRGEVLVITGPIYGNNPVVMGKSKVLVPTHLYKVVLDPKNYQSVAYIVPNAQIVTRRTRTLDEGNPQYPQTLPTSKVDCGSVCTIDNFAVPIRSVEQVTGLRFFSNINNKDYSIVNEKIYGNWKPR